MEPKTVLLIEEHEDNVAIYKTILEHRGYRVLVAYGPEEGVRVARAARPDVVVTELFERTETGWRVPEAIKEDPRTSNIPVIALSSHALPEDREWALRDGCDVFLAKPTKLERVVEEVERFIGPAGG